MASLNLMQVIGNLGRDPETTYTQSGTAVTKITVATSEVWNDKNTGEKREKTEWHRITFFGKQAETIGRYMSKGSQIYVQGKLQTSQYEKDGITRYSTDIIANHFQFIGSKQGDNSGFQQDSGMITPPGGFQQQAGFQQPQNQSGFQQQAPEAGTGFAQKQDDDIPF